MDSKIVEVTLQPQRLLGVACDFVGSMDANSDAHEIIPAAWHTLGHLTSANNLSMDWSLGVMTDSDQPGKMRYTACVPVDTSTVVPDGMVEVLFDGGTYVGCEHVGSLDAIGKTTAWFYRDFLPASEYHVVKAPHLEIYDERFNPESPNSVVTICAPIAV